MDADIGGDVDDEFIDEVFVIVRLLEWFFKNGLLSRKLDEPSVLTVGVHGFD